MKAVLASLLILSFRLSLCAQSYWITADRVFDGEKMHDGWGVVIEKNMITSVGPKDQLENPCFRYAH